MVLIGVCRHFLQRSKTAAGEPGGPCHPPPTTLGPSSACGVEEPLRKRPIVILPNFRAEFVFPRRFSARDRWHGCRSQPCKKVPRRSPATCPTTSPALRTRKPRPFARRAPRGRCTTAQWAVSERRESRKLGAPAADTGLCARRVGCGHQPPDSATPPPNHQCPPPAAAHWASERYVGAGWAVGGAAQPLDFGTPWLVRRSHGRTFT